MSWAAQSQLVPHALLSHVGSDTVATVLESHARRTLDAPFLVFESVPGVMRTLTYAQMDARANQAANLLRSAGAGQPGRLREGRPLSEVTRGLAAAMGVGPTLSPMTALPARRPSSRSARSSPVSRSPTREACRADSRAALLRSAGHSHTA